jgi:hypothetical protein
VFFLELLGRVAGVQLPELELRDDLLEVVSSTTEDLRFLLGLLFDSSSLGDAVRLLEDDEEVCC